MHRARSSVPDPKGSALIQHLLVVALALVTLLQAAPALRDLLLLRRLQSAAAEWSNLLRQARLQTASGTEALRLDLQTADLRCLVLHTGPRGACPGCDGPPGCRSGARMLARTHPLPPEVAITTTAASVQWNPTTRTISPTVTYRLALEDGRALHLILNLLGRLRLCSPDGLVAGVPSC